MGVPTPDNCPRAWADVVTRREADTITLSPREVVILGGSPVPCRVCERLAAELAGERQLRVAAERKLALFDPVTERQLEASR